MPRIKLNFRKYAKADYQAWIRSEMKEAKITNETMGLRLGYSGQNFSQKLASMNFSYSELFSINELLECPPELVIYFMTGIRVKEIN